MKYSIVIPTYNHCADLLKPCVESIIANSCMSEVELIISANGCVDETRSYVEGLIQQYTALGFPNTVKLCWHDQALGYSKACNVAIRQASTDLIVLFNNDAFILPSARNSWLEIMHAQFLADDRCGVCGSNMLHSSISNNKFAIFFCVMIHRKVFDKIGLLNEIYGVGAGEDIEFCWMAERAGFTITQAMPHAWSTELGCWVGNFPLYHKGEGTMHDPNLVQNWAETFAANSVKLATRYKEIFDPSTRLSYIKSWLPHVTPEAHEMWNQVVERNVYHVDESILKNKHVIDIGANIGVFGLLAACMGASKVTCVEPIASIHHILSQNISCAHFHDVIQPIQAVVSVHENQTVTLWVSEKTGHSSLFTHQGLPQQATTITLAQLMDASLDEVFLKLSCEGSEYDILLTAPDHVMQKVSHVALEIHPDLHPQYKEAQILYDKLTSWGFRMLYKNQMVYYRFNEKGEKLSATNLPETVEIWGR